MITPTGRRSNPHQLPLIHVVESDDRVLAGEGDRVWFNKLTHFPWERYRDVGAAYYEALYRFNVHAAAARIERTSASLPPNPETRDEATLRMLFERPTAGNTEVPLLHPAAGPAPSPITVDPRSIAPGVVPLRWAGRTPKCFFALLKAFLGTSLMGRPAEPEEVHDNLRDNPTFARACGFTLPDRSVGYRYSDVPALRKIEQFDQIMSTRGLWACIKWDEVRRNLDDGVVKVEEELVHDTTHYEAFSAMDVLQYEPPQAPTVARPPRPERRRAKRAAAKEAQKAKKSQSRTIKRCRCKIRDDCPHPWVLADDGAGTVVKQQGKMYWAHKAAVVNFARQGIPLDAVAVTDAASHDGQTLRPHIARLFAELPILRGCIERVLADMAYDDAPERAETWSELGVEVKTHRNPRSRKPVLKDLPRGIERITPLGTPVCQAGHSLEFLGVRWEPGRFLFGPPRGDAGQPQCDTCPFKMACCPRAAHGRRLSLPFERLPQVDPTDPHLAKRFQAMMARRSSVERAIKRLKCDLADRRLRKRSNVSFQAYLDKSLWAFHVLLQT
jgi:hypothetical protein